MRKIFCKVLLLVLLSAFVLSAPALVGGTNYDPATEKSLTSITQTVAN